MRRAPSRIAETLAVGASVLVHCRHSTLPSAAKAPYTAHERLYPIGQGLCDSTRTKHLDDCHHGHESHESPRRRQRSQTCCCTVGLSTVPTASGRNHWPQHTRHTVVPDRTRLWVDGHCLCVDCWRARAAGAANVPRRSDFRRAMRCHQPTMPAETLPQHPHRRQGRSGCSGAACDPVVADGRRPCDKTRVTSTDEG